MTVSTYDQIEYAFYNDGSESGSSIIGSSNSQQTLDVDTTYLFRLQIHNDNNKEGNATWTFEFNHAGGGWTDVSTSAAAIQAVDSSNLTEGDDCTNRLTNQGADFISDNNGVTEDGVTTQYSHLAGDYAEILLAFQIPAAQVSDGDEILIRARESGAGRTVTYTVTGDIDVNEGAAPITVNLGLGSLSVNGQQATVVPGAVSVGLGFGDLSANGQQASIDPGSSTTVVNLGLGSLAANGQQLDVVPGAVSVGLGFGDLSANGQQATIDTPWSFPFTDGFESGDTSAWDSETGTPTINGTAALVGSYGMEIAYTDDDTYVSLSWTNATHQIYRAKFKIDTNDISADTDGDDVDILRCDDVGTQTRVGMFTLTRVPTNQLQFQSWFRQNSGVFNKLAWNCSTATEYDIEVEWDWGNGTHKVWIDGNLEHDASGMTADNFYVDSLRWGNDKGSAETFDSGSLYLDAFELHDDARPSGVLVNLGLGSLTATGQQLSVVPGAVSLGMGLGSLAATGQQADVIPGPITLQMGLGGLAISGQQADVVPGLASIALGVGALTATGLQAAISPGVISPTLIPLGLGTLTLAGQQASVIPHIKVNMGLGALGLSGQQAQIIPGPVTVQMATGGLTAAGQQLIVNATGFVLIQLGMGSLTASGQQAQVIPGPVSIPMGLGSITINGQQLDVQTFTSIALGYGSLVSAGQQLNVVPGLATVALGLGTITIDGQTLTVIATGAAIQIPLGVGALAANGQALQVLPGLVSIPMGYGSLVATGQNLSVIPGQVTIPLGAGSLVATGQQLSIISLVFPHLANVVFSRWVESRHFAKFKESRAFEIKDDDQYEQ